MKSLTALLFMMISSPSFAETVHLLDIPLSDNKMFSYTVETEDKCSFSGVKEIHFPRQNEDLHSIPQKLTSVQREVNLEIDDNLITNEKISFNLKGATNYKFEFFFDKKSCKLIRTVETDGEKHEIESIDAEYISPLGSPVVKKMTIKTAENKNLEVYQWAMHGGLPSYELEAGTGIEVHSNIRLNDQKAFHKNDPAVGPVAIFSFRYGPLFINRSGAGALVFNYKKLSLLALGTLEGENYEGLNLEERKSQVYLGGILALGFAEFTYYNDFFDEKGYNLKLNFAPKFYPVNSWRIKPQIYAQYWSDKYVDYYFRVTPAESLASGLRTYSAKNTMNYGAVVEVMKFIGPWTIVNELQAKYFGNQVYNSPTVKKKEELRFTSGFLYKFF